jgi:hypothetical protein
MGRIQEIARENNRVISAFPGARGQVDESRFTNPAYDDGAFLSRDELLTGRENDIVGQAFLR